MNINRLEFVEKRKKRSVQETNSHLEDGIEDMILFTTATKEDEILRNNYKKDFARST